MSTFKNPERIQLSLLSSIEKRCLVWIAQRLPAWIHSDHLTILGFAGMCFAGLAYAMTDFNQYAPLVATFWLFVNWFGDSLDGTVARVRNKQRPRYGFYVDHIVDTFGILFLVGGLAFSEIMSLPVAICFLIAYYILTIDIYLATVSLGQFRMSFWVFGPTELRLLLAIGNVAVVYRPTVHILASEYKLFDVGGFFGIIGMSLVILISVLHNTITLYRAEPNP